MSEAIPLPYYSQEKDDSVKTARNLISEIEPYPGPSFADFERVLKESIGDEGAWVNVAPIISALKNKAENSLQEATHLLDSYDFFAEPDSSLKVTSRFISLTYSRF